MLIFDESKHEYRVNGRVIPSVTQVLQPLVDYSKVPRDVLERAQLLGQAVHRATELHDNDDLDMATLSEELVPYLDAWKRFRQECDFQPITVEEKLHHPSLGYAGTSDRTGYVRGRKAVLDIKKMISLGPVIGIQLAAYQAMHNLRGDSITDRYALGLRADSTYRLEPYTDANDFAVFVSLLTVRNWRIRNGIEV